MDKVTVIIIWVIILSAIIGVLRYWQGANELAKTFFGWVFGESTLLAGLQPSNPTGGVANYPAYNSHGA